MPSLRVASDLRATPCLSDSRGIVEVPSHLISRYHFASACHFKPAARAPPYIPAGLRDPVSAARATLCDTPAGRSTDKVSSSTAL